MQNLFRLRSVSRFIPAFSLPSLAPAFATSAVLCCPALARETVIEDTPSRLVLDVEVPSYAVRPLPEGIRGVGVSAPGYGGAGTLGAPDMPWLRFQVATGDRLPRVSVEPLEWVTVSVPGGLAGVPRWITTTTAEPARDDALFAAARGMAPKVSPAQLVRGLRLRTISVPLGSYAGGEAASMMRRFRVRVDFPSPAPSPFPGVRPRLAHAGVRNVNGGQYLVSVPRSPPLARSAAAARAAAFDAEAPRLQITIGDREVDGLGEDGVYALTFDQLADVVGRVELSRDLGSFRIYAGPKDTLRIAMDSLVAPTLREIPIEVRDANANNTFDAGDTILFYAHGTSIWKPIPGASGAVTWEFKNDPWSFENRYYLQWTGPATGALRLATASSGATGDTVTTAPHYLRAERDLATGACDPAGYWDAETGYAWYWYLRFDCTWGPAPGFGDTPAQLDWSQLRRPSVETLPGRSSDTVYYGFFTYNGPQDDGYTVWAGGGTLPYASLNIPGAWYARTSGSFTTGAGFDSLLWATPHRRFEGYTVRYQRTLQGGAGDNVVFPARAGQRIAYKISAAPVGLRVLRVERGIGAKWLALTPQGASATFTDSIAIDEDVRYVLHRGSPLAVPNSAISLQSSVPSPGVISGLSDGSSEGVRRDPEYLIIAPQALIADAVRLRDYRDHADRQRPWRTAVVRTEDIYREWSGGRMSPVAIRDFLRWAVNRWGAGDAPGSLVHVLLYGDGHYDYRNLVAGNTESASLNHVPPFNIHFEGDPMSSDDFYAVLDSGAGWVNSPLTISLGRLPLKSPDQAQAYLEKISRHESVAHSGAWRGRILLTADDATQRRADRGEDPIPHHTSQAERIGNAALAHDSGLHKETVYLFDYERNSSFLKPAATQDLINQYNRGVLFSTFFGHGAYNQMADEVLLKTNDGLSRLRNADKNFMMTIFSCTVGRFDKVADEGMSEEFVRMKSGGAIAAVSASRETWDSQNEALGYAFTTRVFGLDADSGVVPVGDALRLGKSSVDDGLRIHNNEKYILQGEPVLALRRPGLGLALTQQPDSLEALGCDSLSGRVTRGSGKGAVSVRIVSGDVSKVYDYTSEGIPKQLPPVHKRGQILFETTMPYTDSVFSLRYFIPKQVPFGDTDAKIQLFAWDSLELRESSLLVRDIKISGTASPHCMVNDQRGPAITVTGCNTAEAGGIDFPDKIRIGLPYCLQIAVSDTGGGVLAGDGPDQGTTVEVVGSVAPYQPQAGVDELYRKTYQMPLSPQEVSEGTHLLKISARDGFGNFSQRQVTLQVSADTTLRFVRAFNTPNPLKSGKTTFWFSTSLPVEEGGDLTSPNVDRVRFDLRVFNQLGYMVREFRDAHSGETQWDGRDAWGRQLANGVYFYEVTATWSESNGSPAGGRRTSRKNVLVISR